MDTGTTDKGGWLQINNTVVPYLVRSSQPPGGTPRCVTPLDVIRFGANLLRDQLVQSENALEGECQRLTRMCADVSLNFKFHYADEVELIDVEELCTLCEGHIVLRKLPEINPFEHTRVITECDLSQLTSLEVAMATDPPLAEGAPGGGVNQQQQPSMELTTVLDLSRDSADCDRSVQDIMLTMGADIGGQNEPLDLSVKSPAGQPETQTVQVTPARLFGRKIPCVVKRGVHYVLVETLRRAYFPQCSLRAFMFMVNRSISPFVFDLDRADVEAIKAVSENPTSLSKSIKIISLHDAAKVVPMFRSFLKKVAQQRAERKLAGVSVPVASNGGRDPFPPLPTSSHPGSVSMDFTTAQPTQQLAGVVDSTDCIMLSEFRVPQPQGRIQRIQRKMRPILPRQEAHRDGHQPVTVHVAPGATRNRISPLHPTRKGRSRSLNATLARLHGNKETVS